jgi:hypothetical protein
MNARPRQSSVLATKQNLACIVDIEDNTAAGAKIHGVANAFGYGDLTLAGDRCCHNEALRRYYRSFHCNTDWISRLKAKSRP